MDNKLKNAEPQRVFGVLVGSLTGSDTFYNGLQKANEGFLRAIVRYSQFDEMHFFIRDEWLVSIRAEWQPYIEQFVAQRSVYFVSVHLLPDYLSRYEYEVFHKGDPYIAELADLRASCAKKPYVITGRAHTLSTDCNLSKARDLILSSLTKSDAILCSTEAQKKVMANFFELAETRLSVQTGISASYPGEMSLLPLGIEADTGQGIAKLEARESLGYQQESCMLLCVGRFSPADKMDLHPLLLAINDLLEEKRVSDLLVILAGNGDASGEYIQSLLRQMYELNLEGRVRLELTIDDERKNLLYQAADIFISLSDNMQESFGLAPVEAMNYSLPVILSDWNGYRELVVDGVSGFLINTLSTDNDLISQPFTVLDPVHAHLIEAQGTAVDIEAFVHTVERLVNDKKLRLEVGRAAKQRVVDIFNWPSLIKQYHAIVDRLIRVGCHDRVSQDSSIGLSFQRAFKHYPTDSLKDTDYIETTDRGVRVLLMDEKGFHFREIHHLLETNIIKDLIDFCLNGRSVKDIKQTFSTNNRIEFIVVWMCKYQLISHSKKKPRRKGVIQRSWSFRQTEASINLDIEALLKQIEPRRAAYLTQAIAWMSVQIAPVIAAIDASAGKVMTTILAAQVKWLDEKLLQAIEWFRQDHGLSDYNQAIVKLEKEGGFEVLPVLYPHWFRLGKRVAINVCREVKRMCLRLAEDLPDINECYKDIWDCSATGVVDLSLAGGRIYFSVVILTFDNGKNLVYKVRDVRIDHQIINRSQPGTDLSIAAAVNQWLDGFPGLGTHRIMPRVDQSRRYILHYGYAEFIEGANASKVLTKQQAEDYHQRLGVTIGLALMLGLADLHQCNLISLEDIPFLIDLEKALQPSLFQSLEAEMNNPETAFLRGASGSSVEKTGILDLWQHFQTHEMRLYSVPVSGGESKKLSPALDYLPVISNIIKVGDRHSLDGVEPSLAATYYEEVAKGFKAMITAICEHQTEWCAFLDGTAQMQLTFQPLINHSDGLSGLSNFHIYRGFQRFSHQRLRRYFQRVTTHMCMLGLEVQRWYESKWKEPIDDLSERIAEGWMSGREPLFLMNAGDLYAYTRSNSGALKRVDGGDYFHVDRIAIAKELLLKMASNDIQRTQFVEGFLAMLQTWMLCSLKPGFELPEDVKERILAEIVGSNVECVK